MANRSRDLHKGSHTSVIGTFLNNVSVPGSTTYYSCPFKPTADTSTNSLPWIEGGILSELTLRIQTTPAGGTFVCTLIVNGSATSLTVSVPASSPTGSYVDSVNKVILRPGDTLRWSFANNSATTSGLLTGVTILLTKLNR